MKKKQLLLASLTLTFFLSTSASAGIIETGIAQPSPTPATASAVSEGEGVAEENGVMEAGVESPEPLTEVALSLVQSLLALF